MYRLIVADDEMIECMVLEHIIQNNLKEQIELLDSVQDGVSLLKAVEEKKPDIAIVDINMPGLNGLDAIEIIRMRNRNVKIIIHTAYSEFSYAQKALQLGASDYLLKPNMKEEIIEAVQKICRTLDEENSLKKEHDQSRDAAKSLYSMSADKWLMSLFLEHPDQECYARFREHCPEIAYGGIFTAWKIKEGEGMTAEEKDEIYSSLKDKIYSLCSSVSMMHKDLFYCLFIPGQKVKEGDSKTWLSKLTDFLCREWRRDFLYFLIGASQWKEEDDLISGIHEARIALQHRDQPGLFFFRYKETSHQPVFFQNPLEAARLLLESRLDECIRHANQLFSGSSVPVQVSDDEKFIFLKTSAAVYLLRLEEELNKTARQEFRKDFEFWKEFQKAENSEELLSWIAHELNVLHQIFTGNAPDENTYITSASLYILKHYTRDLPLEEVSDSIGISSFYLSRLLKHEKNITFVEMVTDIRIRKAMLLLAENQKSIREIGAVIGYPNQSYFYKVFKKTTGLALGDIRKYLTLGADGIHTCL